MDRGHRWHRYRRRCGSSEWSAYRWGRSDCIADGGFGIGVGVGLLSGALIGGAALIALQTVAMETAGEVVEAATAAGVKSSGVISVGCSPYPWWIIRISLSNAVKRDSTQEQIFAALAFIFVANASFGL